MFKQPVKFPRMLSWLVLLALLAVVPAYADTLFVAGGDDAGLAAAIAALPPGGNIIIEPSGVFTMPVTLGPDDSEKKIMASPGVTAVFDGAGSPAGTSAFTIAGASNVVLENLKITAWPGDGVLVGPGGTAGSSSAKLINLQITKCDSSAVHVVGSSLAEIEGSRILNNSLGVLLENLAATGSFASATIERTQVRNNKSFGVLFRGQAPGRDRGGRAKIWYSMIDKNGTDGVHVATGNSVTLNNNDVAFNAANGVFFEPGALGSLSFNTIAYNTAAGLAYAGAAVNLGPGNNTITGNAPNVAGPVPPPTNQVGP